MTSFAASPSILPVTLQTGIFGCELVTILAMGFFTTFFCAYFCSKFESFKIVTSFLRNYLTVTKAQGRSGDHGVSFYASGFRQADRKICGSFHCDVNVNSSVPLLFFFGCPAAIFFAIIFIIVFAFNGGAFWPMPHIFGELFEIASPFITDSNSSASVISVLFGFLIIASIKHASPNTVIWWVSIFPRHCVSPTQNRHLAYLPRNAIGELNAP